MTLSIIVPFYNTEQYIIRCIDSILSQTFSDWELILIDDGSTDESYKLCIDYASKDPRIKVLTQSNSGQGAARNNGLKHSKGEFVTFIDSDDVLLDSNSLLFAMNAFSSFEDIDIVQFPFKKYNEESTIVQPLLKSKILSSKEEFILYSDILNMIQPTDVVLKTSPWPKVYRRELFDNVKFPEGIIYEDTYMFCEMLPQIRSIVIIDKGLYGNYERMDSTTTSPMTAKKAHDRVVVLTKVYHTLCEYSKNKKLRRKMLVWLVKIISSFKAKCLKGFDVSKEIKSLNHSYLMGGVFVY